MKLLISILLFLTVSSCNGQESPERKMTMILHDNQNPNSEWTKDILIKDSIISIDSALIDFYFLNKVTHIPYYLPSNGIFRDSIKDDECKIDTYPADVKCYEYDEKNKVKKMSVNGSGSMGDWTHKYDSLDRIVEIKRFSTTYTAKYMGDLNLLTEVIVDGGLIQKRIEIQYKK